MTLHTNNLKKERFWVVVYSLVDAFVIQLKKHIQHSSTNVTVEFGFAAGTQAVCYFGFSANGIITRSASADIPVN